ncbi:hypothetical protein AN958_07565 [Leucoagaricus sp. SymC.cos]|nr:hypothetical protein AN958_07565 [Leucoagaricus sp. SymC.cos]
MFPFSPRGIHALPVELLTRIFVLGAEDDDPYKLSPFLLKPDQHYYAIPSTLFQLTASHVCHHWRQLALRTPALWTTLFFREHSHILRAVAYLARCSRSQSRRLDILVDTVAPKDHIPGVTLCRDELIQIFDLICPHVPFWRAFHLKIRDDGCKQIARKYLGNAPPAPNLETLQLYHFEDFRVAQDLYIATYRRPVRIFSNSLPRLRNVSLIGVNLPWDQSPYLHNLHMLELALHSDHTRPPYVWWDRMLRFSPHLQRLLLHYSGPRAENGTEDLAWTTHDYNYYDSDYHYPPKGKAKLDDRVLLDSLSELSLTDLDPDYLCRVLQRLVMPNVNKLSLDLPDQDFTPFVELIVTPPPPPSSLSSYDLSSVGNGEDEASGSSTITTITSSTSSIQAINNSSTTTFAAKHWPLPRIFATLHTLIITALECDFTAWKALFWSLEGVSVLEINFDKISLTCDSEKVKCAGRVACGVLLDLVLIHAQKGPKGRNVRMVLPRLGKCRIEGLGGRDIKCLVQGREALAFGRAQEIEWTVVEDKFAEDQIMSEILEKGVWVSSRVDDGGGGGECGRWVKVLKVVEDEEDEVEDDEEDAAGEDEVDVEQEDGEDEADEAVEEEEANDVELDSSTVSAAVAAEGEDIQQVIAEQYTYYLDARSTTSNTRVPITSSHTTAKSRVASSSGSSSSTLTSISSSSVSSSFASSTTIKANRSGARRTDGHRGME